MRVCANRQREGTTYINVKRAEVVKHHNTLGRGCVLEEAASVRVALSINWHTVASNCVKVLSRSIPRQFDHVTANISYSQALRCGGGRECHSLNWLGVAAAAFWITSLNNKSVPFTLRYTRWKSELALSSGDVLANTDPLVVLVVRSQNVGPVVYTGDSYIEHFVVGDWITTVERRSTPINWDLISQGRASTRSNKVSGSLRHSGGLVLSTVGPCRLTAFAFRGDSNSDIKTLVSRGKPWVLSWRLVLEAAVVRVTSARVSSDWVPAAKRSLDLNIIASEWGVGSLLVRPGDADLIVLNRLNL